MNWGENKNRCGLFRPSVEMAALHESSVVCVLKPRRRHNRWQKGRGKHYLRCRSVIKNVVRVVSRFLKVISSPKWRSCFSFDASVKNFEVPSKINVRWLTTRHFIFRFFLFPSQTSENDQGGCLASRRTKKNCSKSSICTARSHRVCTSAYFETGASRYHVHPLRGPRGMTSTHAHFPFSRSGSRSLSRRDRETHGGQMKLDLCRDQRLKRSRPVCLNTDCPFERLFPHPSFSHKASSNLGAPHKWKAMSFLSFVLFAKRFSKLTTNTEQKDTTPHYVWTLLSARNV